MPVGLKVTLSAADLWLANGNKVPTKIISQSRGQGHTQELKKRLKKGEERSECALLSDVVGLGAEGSPLQEKGGQCTLQASAHTSTTESKSTQTKSHKNPNSIFCPSVITHGFGTTTSDSAHILDSYDILLKHNEQTQQSNNNHSQHNISQHKEEDNLAQHQIKHVGRFSHNKGIKKNKCYKQKWKMDALTIRSILHHFYRAKWSSSYLEFQLLTERVCLTHE